MKIHQRHPGVYSRIFFILLIGQLTACQLNLPQLQPEVKEVGAVAEPVAAGILMPASTLQTFLPKEGSGFFIEIIQAGEGSVEAALKLETTQIATLSIRDTVNDPGANADFQSSSLSVAGYPALEVDDQTTTILVANRYRVTVRSIAPDFTQDVRHYWLGEFDLAGLAALQ